MSRSYRVKIRGRRYKIIIKPPQQRTVAEKAKRRRRRFLTIEKAKSGRSKCKTCRSCIKSGTYRVGLITFIPHRNVKWFHLKEDCVSKLAWSLMLDKCLHWDDVPYEQQQLAKSFWESASLSNRVFVGISGPLSMSMMADALTGRYDRFRSFRFALPDSSMYSSNWNWRCFLATILVSDTREETMLYITDRLFKEFPNQESLLSLYKNPETREKWTLLMEKEKLRHSRRKMRHILYATKLIAEQHDGKIPTDRADLRKIPGVGAHVSSVTMAWVHQAPEFGIDRHVRRIMERWGWIPEKHPEKKIETMVKGEVSAKKLGHFSRAFVDHGQSVCGYVPDCANCYLKNACPASAKYLDW